MEVVVVSGWRGGGGVSIEISERASKRTWVFPSANISS